MCLTVLSFEGKFLHTNVNICLKQILKKPSQIQLYRQTQAVDINVTSLSEPVQKIDPICV